MKTDLKKRRKYAFNINEIKIKKKFQGSLNDFQKLNRGVYDEIESNDISIKESKKKLKKLKNISVKEFVYTNKQVPDHWKTKFDYNQNLLKTFIKDPKFLYYLGHGGGGDSLRTIKESEKNNNSPQNALNKASKEKKNFPKIDNNIRTSSPIKTTSNQHIIRNGKFKENNISDKEILGILDDFKNAYPLFDKEKNQEIYNTKNIVLNDIDKKNKTFYDSRNSQSNNYLTNRKKVSIDVRSLSSFPSIKQKHNRRQNTFRQNIFTNLLPSDSKNRKNFNKNKPGFMSCTNFRKKKIDTKNKTTNIFLNSDNEIFDKKININNPTVIKYLEGINFFGPYYSYCPPCGNRNLEFYKNLEPNQCLQIIQQIKKNKGKNIILNNNNKNKDNNPINQVEQIHNRNKETIDISIKNYNSGSMKNNYEGSDNNSMIQQVSGGSEEKENYDMFD